MADGVGTISDANRLGLDYRQEAQRLPWGKAPASQAGRDTGPGLVSDPGEIWDVHSHIADIHAARLLFEVADLYRVRRVWTMTQLEQVDAIREEFGDRVEFIAVPNYEAHEDPETFTTDWLRRIEGFAAKGCKLCKFWAAPRGVDFARDMSLCSPVRRESMRLAKSLGMSFMTHVGDPDTWFATTYKDSKKYGTKAEHHAALERSLDDFGDVIWIAAHMGGDPEHLDNLQGMLDRHPNLYVDTSATKWMVRELSKHPARFRDFCRDNPGRVLFGSDNVADPRTMTFDLLASRYWALRTLFETDYDGPSPIVDPDLSMVDPTVPENATARLCGAMIDDKTLATVYHNAAERLLAPLYDWGRDDAQR